MIRLKRAYEPATNDDGVRVLVERLWPRGVTKTRLKVDEWVKDVAPSANLRKGFSHDPKKWPEFRRRYFTELRAHPAAWQPLISAARRGRVTFVYAAHDAARNGAVALKTFLDRRLSWPDGGSSPVSSRPESSKGHARAYRDDVR
jgi:uncharacterized protein YeaO (DUF488 family)